MTRDIQRSRYYYFGEGKKFATEEEARRQAEYKMQAMLAEIKLSSKISFDGEPEIVSTNGAVHVRIPVAW